MGIEVEARKPHVLVIPWPGQGHINPSLAFAKCLASKHLLITLVITTKVAKSANFSDCASVAIDSISDGSEDVKGTESMEAYLKRFQTVFTRNLETYLDEHTPRAKAIVYDSGMPFVLDIAHERGLLGAPFFTQTCAVSAVFYHMKEGLLRYPYEDCTVDLPALPKLEKKDLPYFQLFGGQDNYVMELMGNQFLNLERADWIFFNTFDKLESQIIEWMRSRWPIKAVGPTFLLNHGGDKHSGSTNHSISLFEPKHVDAYKQWLDSKPTSSVVYVSFGSMASLTKEQMQELANALTTTNSPFLWVVRSSELEKLPEDFASSNPENGLIVEWCHQPEVLAHPAVACFLTHCGWNSTLEALSNGVPLIAMAQWVDQSTNAKFIEDVWGVGVGVKSGEGGIVGREEIVKCVEQVVGGDEFRRNAWKWKEMAVEAVGNGGTSAKAIDEFVSKLIFAEEEEVSPTSVLVQEERDCGVVDREII